MTELNQNIAETVAREARKPFSLTDKGAYIALPDGWKLEDTEKNDPQPHRKKGKVKLDDTESFIAYTKRHGSLTESTVWCQANYTEGKVSFTAIINDHGETEADAAWRDHVATFSPVFSEEWKRWFGKNGATFSQFEFARFIEENIKDIATQEGSPTGAMMLEMALAFESTQDSRFKSAIRLQNGGVQMQFTEDDDAQTIQKMQIFERFTVGIPVFWNGGSYAVDARLRYRTRDGKLTFWFELIRPDRVLEDASKSVIDRIKNETGRPLFMGNPF